MYDNVTASAAHSRRVSPRKAQPLLSKEDLNYWKLWEKLSVANKGEKGSGGMPGAAVAGATHNSTKSH